jgi:hypothetical protein
MNYARMLAQWIARRFGLGVVLAIPPNRRGLSAASANRTFC